MPSNTYPTFALDDLNNLRESAQVEFKLAGGRDGKGKLPEAIWESYSAFANTLGGEIILGVKEDQTQGTFTIEGIVEPLPLLNEIWQILNDPSRISHNVLSSHDVQIVQVEGKQLIRIHVPAVEVKQRPIYIGRDKYAGTFYRVGDADKRASKTQVDEMSQKPNISLLSK